MERGCGQGYNLHIKPSDTMDHSTWRKWLEGTEAPEAVTVMPWAEFNDC